MVTIVTTSPVQHRDHITCPTLHRTGHRTIYTGAQEMLGNGGGGGGDNDNRAN